jgi:hypothetical protein
MLASPAPYAPGVFKFRNCCVQVQTTTAFEQLLGATAELGSRLLVDLSDHLDLSSLPGANGVLEFMASKPLPAHATIFCSLVKNQVTITRQTSLVCRIVVSTVTVGMGIRN